tara:strand:- start:1005 stop:1886 length:882 start_codon:yes stop_codon:yes gene_type:complete
MNLIKSSLYTLISVLLLIGISYASSLENKVTSYFNNIANNFGDGVANILSQNSRVKHLELDIGVQEHLKPTLSLTNVNRISENNNSVLFNQNSLNLHNNDQTVNLGIGYRTLQNDEKIILGFNLFLDYSFDDSHQRNGAGIEVISSIFDLRSNIYDATSGIETVTSAKDEEAMDGWDLRLDYHLPVEVDTRIFAGLFEFENGSGSFEVDGERYGLNIINNQYDVEIGYIDDNRTGDGAFANFAYVIPLGETKANKIKSSSEFVSVSDRIYEPVKRENKIRVVSTVLNIKASGF